MAKAAELTFEASQAQSLELGQPGQLRVHPSVLDAMGGCWIWAIVEVCYNVSLNPVSANLTVKLAGVQVANVTLDAQNPRVDIDVSVAGIGLEAVISLYIPDCDLGGSFTIKYFVGSKTWSGVIYHWC
ncbi:MAG: hypothetical protein QOH93_1661 [Chloroflexia bacterium]|jgi:hypothetical protein|nr:hypothetical protein [Chloroflexia bacterium]